MDTRCITTIQKLSDSLLMLPKKDIFFIKTALGGSKRAGIFV